MGAPARRASPRAQRAQQTTAAVLAALGLLLVAFLLLRGTGKQLETKAYPLEYGEFVEKYSAEYGVDPWLVYSVIYNESRFQPDALSNVGARGLMQMMEASFDWTKNRLEPDSATVYDAMYDPETNIRYGTYMLSLLLEEFGTVNNALCAYHAGWGSVKGWLDDPENAPDGENVTNIPFADTRSYVEKVNKTMEKYRKLYSAQ